MKSTLLSSMLVLFTGIFMGGGHLSAAGKTTGSMSRADKVFSTKAAAGGIAEVQFGELALKNASSSDVKKFAQKMVDDHGKANDKLKSIASKDNITVPSDMDAKEKATYNRLSKLQGSDFDRAYMQDMVKDHKTDVAEFQKEANSGTQSDLKNFASETLPTLQQHLKMAEETAGKVK